MKTSISSVIIVGGGMSGLAAAVSLLQIMSHDTNKMNVTLLESKDRLGGRVWTVHTKNTTASSTATTTPLDLGAMYWHGGLELSVLQDLMKRYASISSSSFLPAPLQPLQTFVTGGTSAHPAHSQAVWKIQVQPSDDDDNNNNIDDVRMNGEWQDLTDEQIQRGHDLWAQWNHYLQQQQEQQLPTTDATAMKKEEEESEIIIAMKRCLEHFQWNVLQTTQDRRLFLFQLHMAFPLDAGIPFHRAAPLSSSTSSSAAAGSSSSNNNSNTSWDWVNVGGADVVMATGMESVISALRHTVEQDPRGTIHLGERVVTIEQWSVVADRLVTGTAATTTARDNEDYDKSATTPRHCRVTTASGRAFEARACIVTLPLGVLKEKAAHHHHDDDDPLSPPLFRPPLPARKREALRRAGLGTLNTVVVQWNRPVCRPESGVTAYYLIAASAAVAQQNGNKDSTRGINNNPLRHGFICSGLLRGKARQDPTITQFHLSETEHLDFDNLTYWKEQAWEVVRPLVKDTSDNDDTPLQIVDLHVSQWHLDPDILGSYSAPTTLTRGDSDRQLLAESVDRVWFFAGEHTHYEGRYQSIDGAYETGVRAANEVQDVLYHHHHHHEAVET